MRYKIYKNGVEINVIVADESFVSEYCAKNGYTYEESPLPEPEPVTPPTSAQLREEAYNTQAIIAWNGEMLTVTQAAQLWQYYAAEGASGKTLELTQLISEAKATIREQYPDEEAEQA